MARVIFHLDMDAFYASVEQRDYPELRGKPVVVGGSPDSRGVVCAASYEARKFGVRSAIPCATARRLCPQAIFVRPRFERYHAIATQIRERMRATGAVVEPVSIDEAYLELTALYARGNRDPDEALLAALPVARDLKAAIQSRTGLTCSIGIATNKLLAKIASALQKPDGMTLIPERDKAAFLRPLPVRSIPGVGRVTAGNLELAGIKTIGDLQAFRGDLRPWVGSWADQLMRYAVGDDDRPLSIGDEMKSISSEVTFERDTDDRRTLREALQEQAAELAAKLQRSQLSARTIQVKVRYADFSTLTRQTSVEDGVRDAADILRLACHLLARNRLVTRPLRLIGIQVSSFRNPTPQMILGLPEKSR
jgi:DNA polymerase-4